jgi:hypothetical protein
MSKKNFIYKWLIKKSYTTKPEFIIALGPKQAKYIAEECYKEKDIKTLLLPCGFLKMKLIKKSQIG